MADAPLVLGVDGGGSKTLLALAKPDGTIAHLRRAGGSNPLDQPTWRARLADLFIDLPGAQAAAIGLAGFDEIPEISAVQAKHVAGLLHAPHTLHNDVQIAFDGAFQSRPGVLILAGTGSMAWAQDGMGRTVRVGGWGAGFGDEGSAFWIGQRALSLASQARDGRIHAPAFAAAVAEAVGLAPDAPDAALLDWHRRLAEPRAGAAALARCVASLAAGGELVASALVGEAAEMLCQHVQAARRRIGRTDLAWSHAGGVFASATLRDRMIECLGPRVAPMLPPIGGALWRAATQAGWPVGGAFTARLTEGLAAAMAREDETP